MALEGADQESQQALLVGMEYLLSISFVDDDEVCSPCSLEFPSRRCWWAWSTWCVFCPKMTMRRVVLTHP